MARPRHLPVLVEPYDHVAGLRRAYIAHSDGVHLALVGTHYVIGGADLT